MEYRCICYLEDMPEENMDFIRNYFQMEELTNEVPIINCIENVRGELETFNEISETIETSMNCMQNPTQICEAIEIVTRELQKLEAISENIEFVIGEMEKHDDIREETEDIRVEMDKFSEIKEVIEAAINDLGSSDEISETIEFVKTELAKFKSIKELIKTIMTYVEKPADIREAIKTYYHEMAENFQNEEIIYENEELIELHKRAKENCIDEFKENSNNHEVVKELNRYFDDSFKTYINNNIRARVEKQMIRNQNLIDAKIISELKDFNQCLALDTYIEEMKNSLPNSVIYENEKLVSIHKKAKEIAIAQLNQDNSNDSVAFDQQILEQKIAEQFEKISTQNKMTLILFSEKIEESTKQYERKIFELTNLAAQGNNFSLENSKLSKKLKDELIGFNKYIDNDALQKYLEEFSEKIDKSFEEAKNIFEIKIRNEELKKAAIDEEIRNEYKKIMEDKIHIKPFYLKTTIKTFHEEILEEITTSLNKPRTSIEPAIEDLLSNYTNLSAINTPKELTIGIDLGNTNACVAYIPSEVVINSRAVVIPNEFSKNLTPCVVSFRSNNIIIVGEEAKNDIDINPQNTIHSVKRLIGKTYKELFEGINKQKFLDLEYQIIDFNNEPKILIKDDKTETFYSPEDIFAKILQKLKTKSESHLKVYEDSNMIIKRAVITVPFYFNDSQIKATKRAADIAGFKEIEIINEPTAAAFAYELNMNFKNYERNILYFDFGGSTFNIAIVKFGVKGKKQILVGNGDYYLGGDDLDNNLIDYCIQKFISQNKLALEKHEIPMIRINSLKYLCQECKIKLSDNTEETIKIKNFYNSKNKDFDMEILVTHELFEVINKEIFEKIVKIIEETFEKIKMSYLDISDVLFVGGSSRIPKLRESIRKLFKNLTKENINYPDLSVVVGAALYAAKLSGEEAQKKVRVTKMSLGIENISEGDQHMVVLVPIDSKYPTKFQKIFKLSNKNDENIKIKIYEGENKLPRHNKLLDIIEIFNGSREQNRQLEILVIFEMNEDGELFVTVRCEQEDSISKFIKHNCLFTVEEMEERINLYKKLDFLEAINGKYCKDFCQVKSIGEGNYGTVYEVFDIKDNKRYAIKKIELKKENSQKYCKLESDLLLKCASPYVVKMIQAWSEGLEFGYIQMELGISDLASILGIKGKQFGRAKGEEMDLLEYFISFQLFQELTECLNYLHSMKPPILHRDLKPDNVLITEEINGRFLKLCDFGLAKIHEHSSHTQGLGTIKYVAPEVLKSKKYNLKADIYSLAIIAQEIFECSHESMESLHIDDLNLPYFQEIQDVISKMKSKLPEVLPEVRPHCPELLERFNNYTFSTKLIELIFSQNEKNDYDNDFFKRYLTCKIEKFRNN